MQQDLQTWEHPGLQPTVRLAVTCLDQVGWPLTYVQGGRLQEARTEAAFLEAVVEQLRPGSLFVSHGPTRGDVSMQ